MWVRGLKPFLLLTVVGEVVSHPMWVRGLKPKKMYRFGGDNNSRTPCGCVD